MPIYLYASLDSAQETLESALGFTRGDHFKALAGYQVMATHFHMGLVAKALRADGSDGKVADLEVLKAAGITIVAPIDGGGADPAAAAGSSTPARGGGGQVDNPKWMQWTRGLGAPPELILDQALAYTGVTRADLHLPSVVDALLAPAVDGRARSVEPGLAAVPPILIAAKPFITKPPADSRIRISCDAKYGVAARRSRQRPRRALRSANLAPGVLDAGARRWTVLVEDNSTYGHVYHVGTTADMMEMAHREDIQIYMPHPRSKVRLASPTPSGIGPISWIRTIAGLVSAGAWAWMGQNSDYASIAACPCSMT